MSKKYYCNWCLSEIDVPCDGGAGQCLAEPVDEEEDDE